MERLKNLKWENGQDCAEALKQERGGTPRPSFNKNTLPHNFTTDYLDSHPSSGWHTYQIFHSFLSGNRVIFCVSLMHVGFSGLKSSELSQLNPNRTS